MAFGLGLLFLTFRQIERWLHQHIFKVGWLLSGSFQITTVLYYILFLPGIVLHEATLWLAASLLNARAERSIRFPEPQAIGELRLNFIRLAEDTGRAKRMIVRLCPVAAGMAALWAIAANVFRWEELLGLAAEGSLDSLVAALSSLGGIADLWLWFYLAFVIANTMFPTLAVRSDRREKALVLVIAPALTFIIWGLGGAANPAIAREIEAFLGSIGLVIAQIAFVNAVAVVALGTVEALTERASNRSATFRDGLMLTMSRQEAREFKAAQRRDSRELDKAQPKSHSAPSLNSIYELKLPIPGPPGREPVSRSAVAVVNLEAPEARPSPVPAPKAEAAKTVLAEKSSTSSSRRDTMQDSDKRISVAQPRAAQDAPFDRPFVKRGSAGDESEAWREERDAEGTEPFARPFVMASRGSALEAESAVTANDTAGSQDLADDQPGVETPREPPSREVRQLSRTRPAPKPSQGAARDPALTKPGSGGELEYEAFEDDAPYIDDDDVGKALG